ncbi:isomerizing glutamine--fructose-6-phosphate transaminase [Deefgea rivuli]|uniref:isomerizing glutamine--fructose-6-phosphate transaminase n=1 Tax=Deefgea rivuli TaxID=400948 RepID=UPI000688241C|nr:isomerizing glutamine--fructose-6-phosphate transaminase [Deefgea rivuli]
MSELIAYIAPQNVLPALSDCLLILNSNSTHLHVQQAEDESAIQRHYVLQMPVQRLVFPPVNCHWLIAALSNDPHQSALPKLGSLVVTAVGLCTNHLDLARALDIALAASLSDLVAALLQRHLHDGATLADAIIRTNAQLKGDVSYVCHQKGQTQFMFASCMGRPLFVGLESGLRQICCSNLRLIRQRANQVYAMATGDIVRFGLGVPSLILPDGSEQALHMPAVNKSQNIPHYMLEEIEAQPETLAILVQKYSAGYSLPLPLRGKLAGIRRLTLLACGSSYHAALVASYWFETLAGIPVQVGLSSEYVDRDIHADPYDLIVAISQSGETADTIAALQHVQNLSSARTVALTNSPGSTLTTLVDHTLLTHSGAEQSVSATKSLTAQLLMLYVLAFSLGEARGKLSKDELAAVQQEMLTLPTAVAETLQLGKDIRRWAGMLHRKKNLFVIGRNTHYPVAMEGAFKLREVAYQHAAAFPAGELKHGPITLVNDELPVIVCLPWNQQAQKMLDDLKSVRANRGEIFILSNGNIASVDGTSVIRMPNGLTNLSPIIYTVALQMLAYYCAVLSGNDIDAPRNLAKTKTVELA